MGRLLTFLIVFPLAALMVAFSVANRGPVAVDAWPLPYSVELPLAAVVLISLFVGVLVGGCAAWASALVKRRQIKLRAREAEAALRREADALRARLAQAEARAGNPSGGGPRGLALRSPPADAA